MTEYKKMYVVINHKTNNKTVRFAIYNSVEGETYETVKTVSPQVFMFGLKHLEDRTSKIEREEVNELMVTKYLKDRNFSDKIDYNGYMKLAEKFGISRAQAVSDYALKHGIKQY